MAEDVEVGVLLEVLDAVTVAVEDGVRVEVIVGVDVFEDVTVAVGVDEAVGVLVDGSPVKVKDPEDFHSLPAKIWTS